MAHTFCGPVITAVTVGLEYLAGHNMSVCAWVFGDHIELIGARLSYVEAVGIKLRLLDFSHVEPSRNSSKTIE